MEKAQKLSVLTGRVCSSHGFGRGVEGSWAGKTVESMLSSATRSCHTLNVLSRPWLMAADQSDYAICRLGSKLLWMDEECAQ
jgi:hypothetical protein